MGGEITRRAKKVIKKKKQADSRDIQIVVIGFYLKNKMTSCVGFSGDLYEVKAGKKKVR